MDSGYTTNAAPCSNKSAHNTSRNANRQTIGRDVFCHHTARTDNGVVSDADAGKDDRARADPHVIFNDNLCGRRRHLALFHTVLVPVQDKRVVTQPTVAADIDLFVCRDRQAIVNERMVAYRDARIFVRDQFDRDDVPHQGNAMPKFHISVTPETNAPREPHR